MTETEVGPETKLLVTLQDEQSLSASPVAEQLLLYNFMTCLHLDA